MQTVLPIIYLAGCAETAWSLSGQHAGFTDLPLTERGERSAFRLKERLSENTFAKVFTSPQQSAVRTCELAGFAGAAEVDPGLIEWDYGLYEGRTLAEIRIGRPDWQLFRDGCPGGETPEQIVTRVDQAIERVRAIQGDALLFAGAHFIRLLAARWIGLAAVQARSFLQSTAALSALGYEETFSQAVIRLWNDTGHVEK